LVLVGVAATALACASAPRDLRYGPDYDLSYVPRYMRAKPPRCPYDEVGMLRYGGRLSQPSEGAERVEQGRRRREMRERDIRASLNKYDADALMTTRASARAGPLLFIRFKDRDCLE
jgi:hypothetical protein